MSNEIIEMGSLLGSGAAIIEELLKAGTDIEVKVTRKFAQEWLDRFNEWKARPDPLSQALNEGNGIYKP